MAKVLWLFGLSGSGKSTLSKLLLKEIQRTTIPGMCLDGDVLRNGINADLDFSSEGRRENLRRIAHIAKILVNNGISAIVACITPTEADREMVQSIVGPDLVFIYVKCPVEICEQRDVKGLYKKARNGEIPLFTGISSGFEEPISADVIVDTSNESPEESHEYIINYLIR